MKKKWWHESVVYQIYPRSFNDSNGDGIGDIQGIIQRLDYLKELGIDIIWLSPVYQSPNDDNGYDISDYYNIMDEFGTMADMEELLEEAKQRGIRIVMDLVVNHTSDEHMWFVESKKSKDNPYRNFYVWRDPVDGKEPSEQGSFFGGSAWEYDEKTGQYFLHIFSKKQPDLNWDNVNVRDEVYKMMNFWLDKGIGGFRMDVIDLVGKDIDQGVIANGSNLHKYLQEMHKKTLANYEVVTVGETPFVNTEIAKLYSGEDRNELDMVFTFEHVCLDEVPNKGKWNCRKLNLQELKQVLSKWQVELHNKGWNSLYWNNHDQPRIISRFGNDQEYRVLSGKMLAILLHMMQGTPYIYQGEEIGMTNIRFESIDDYKDIETLNMYKEKIENGYKHDDIMETIYIKGRDNARTPMQWDESVNAGFTDGNPWIKVNPNYKNINVLEALKDEDSLFYHYKKLIHLRKTNEIVIFGDYKLLLEDHPSIFAYTRTLGKEKLLVVCNFYEEETKFELPKDISYKNIEILISNYKDSTTDIQKINLKPFEAVVYKLTKE